MTASTGFGPASRQQPATIGRETVDQEQFGLVTLASNDFVKRCRRFDGLPLQRALAPVRGNLPPHLRVSSPGGSHKRDPARTRGLRLRIATLAAPHASQ